MNTRFDNAWSIFPDMGRIQHLPWKPNTDRGDLVATYAEAAVIFDPSLEVVVEDKVDGSQVAMYMGEDGVPVVRNKNHVLVKGYGRKGTPAKAQYAPLWNWAYEHADCFEKLYEMMGEVVGVYGEWVYAEHTIKLDLAPDDFIAYEIFVPSEGCHISAMRARGNLYMAGFSIPNLLLGNPTGLAYEALEKMTLEQHPWSSVDHREGVMVKVSKNGEMLHRFKMRREDFKPREDFNDTPLRRRGR